MTTSLGDLVARFGSPKVVVFGDIMLDRYWWGDVTRISPEAPVPILRRHRTSMNAGGAANVALNLAGLGAEVTLVGVVGEDEAAFQLTEIVRRHDINVDRLRKEPRRPTTTKTRVVAQHQHMLRIDEEDSTALSDEETDRVVASAISEIRSADAVVISDYAKGFVTERLARQVINQCAALGRIVLVDPKGSSYSKYEAATIIKPNRLELSVLTNMAVTDHGATLTAGRWLGNRLGGSTLVVTEGRDGMTIFQDGAEEIEIPTAARQVFDVTGAGDAVLATLAVAVAAGANLKNAADLANHAAGCVVGEVGTATITRCKLLKSLGCEGADIGLGRRFSGS
jgi:rfaE bifunctional protein kinase chain/domain